ncbi:SMI1/KNR4 family protein [Flavobacterium columnare]|uniref:SMI1/KNR4 family protein n=1 Tax=Flavobacterium columnare TaxID=996 RepID=UPI00403319BD
MYKYIFENTSLPLEKEDFIELSNKIKLNIPPDIINLYSIYNGGEIREDRYIYINEDTDMEVSVNTFFPIKYKRNENDSSIEERYDFFVNKKRLVPSNYIPFAMDDGGYPFCINIDNNKIYMAYLEDYEETNSHMRLVSDSLEHFVNNMLTEEEAGW